MSKKVFIAGHRGMVGSAIMRQLDGDPGIELVSRSHSELDLLDQAAVYEFLATEKPQEVYLAAAKVGGIHANNSYPAEFIHDNLVIEANLVHGAFKAGVQRLLFLGSSCIYPKHAEQPMREESLLTGVLEPTNEPYALAKIAGIKLCESYNRQYDTDYRSVMPTNLYGPNDYFHPENSHVLPALLARFHQASEQGQLTITIWGTGKAMREFLHVDDMAAACVHVMGLAKETYQAHTEPMLSHLNVGTGIDCTIRELAETIADVTGFTGELQFDTSKPDGTARKLLNVEKLKSLGWQAQIELREGVQDAYDWYRENISQLRQ